MLNSKRFLECMLFVCIVFFPYVKNYAQTSYAMKKLSNLAERMQEKGIVVDSFKTSKLLGLGLTNSLSLEYSPVGVVTHLGVKLFEQKLYDKFPSPIYHFMERYFLELLLIENDNRLQKKLYQDRVKISSEMFTDVPLRSGLCKMMSSFSPDCSIYISTQHSRYRVQIRKGQQLLCALYFPMRYELITGINKLEAEASIYSDVLKLLSDSCKVMKVDEFDLLPYKDSMLMVNDAYYMKEDIRSNAYYRLHKGKALPVRSREFGVESVRNLFNASHKWNVTASVTQKMYQGTRMFDVPVSRLMELIRLQNCRTYVGIRSVTNKKIQGVALAINGELGYQHMFIFSLPTTFLDDDVPVTMQITMYSYIPIHNVSSLWEFKTKRINKS